MRHIITILLLSLCFAAHAQTADTTYNNPDPNFYDFPTVYKALQRKQVNNMYRFHVSSLDGGWFVIRKRSAGFTPDGVRILAMADSIHAAVHEETLVNKFYVKAYWFKIIGDGVTDDYNGLIRLVNWVNTVGKNGTDLWFDKSMNIKVDTFQKADKDSVYIINNSDSSGGTSYDDTTTTIGAFAANDIKNIRFIGCKNLTIHGNGATISVRANFNRTATRTDNSGRKYSGYSVVNPLEFALCKNVLVENLYLKGNNQTTTENDKDVFEGDDFGVVIKSSDNVHLINVHADNFPSDGFYIEALNSTNRICHHIILDNCGSNYSGRNNLTVGGCKDCQFLNSDFSHAGDTTGMGNFKGNAPRKGMDIEPNYKRPFGEWTENILIDGCRFDTCRGGTYAGSLNDRIRNVKFTNNHVDNRYYGKDHEFIFVTGIDGWTCTGNTIWTGTAPIYPTWHDGVVQRNTWNDNIIYAGGEGFKLGAGSNAQYGLTIKHNQIIGVHDTSFHGIFPYINALCDYEDNVHVIDSALYVSGSGGILYGIARGNQWFSELLTGGMYTISYASVTNAMYEDYTNTTTVRPLNATTWNPTTSNRYYSTGEVSNGARQTMYIGGGKFVTQYWNNTLPTGVTYKIGDVVRITDPSTGIFSFTCNTPGIYGVAHFDTLFFNNGGVGSVINSSDTTIFQTVIDSTGQPGYRVLWAKDGKISSDNKMIYSSDNNKLVLGYNNISVGGGGYSIFVAKKIRALGGFVVGDGSKNYFVKSNGTIDSSRYVKYVKLNGTTYTPDTTNTVDLGTVSGGGGTTPNLQAVTDVGSTTTDDVNVNRIGLYDGAWDSYNYMYVDDGFWHLDATSSHYGDVVFKMPVGTGFQYGLPEATGGLTLGVKINGTTHFAQPDGIADLGTISGGGGSGTVTSVGLTSSDITVGGTSPITGSGTYTLTLPTVNSNVGTFGSSTAIPVITANAKGQITGVTTTSITNSFIQNQTGQQSSSNFNISGNGTATSFTTPLINNAATANGTVGSSTYAMTINNALTAGANSQKLYGLNVTATRNIGSYTLTTNYPFSVQNGALAVDSSGNATGRQFIASDLLQVTGGQGLFVGTGGGGAGTVQTTTRMAMKNSYQIAAMDAGLANAFASINFVNNTSSTSILSLDINGATNKFRLFNNTGFISVNSSTDLGYQFGTVGTNSLDGKVVTDANGVFEKYTTSTVDPTTSDIATGTYRVWLNSTSGILKMWANVGGTLHSITIP